MADALEMKPSLGSTIRAIDRNGAGLSRSAVGELILGGIASTNLLAANLASVLFGLWRRAS